MLIKLYTPIRLRGSFVYNSRFLSFKIKNAIILSSFQCTFAQFINSVANKKFPLYKQCRALNFVAFTALFCYYIYVICPSRRIFLNLSTIAPRLLIIILSIF